MRKLLLILLLSFLVPALPLRADGLPLDQFTVVYNACVGLSCLVSESFDLPASWDAIEAPVFVLTLPTGTMPITVTVLSPTSIDFNCEFNGGNDDEFCGGFAPFGVVIFGTFTPLYTTTGTGVGAVDTFNLGNYDAGPGSQDGARTLSIAAVPAPEPGTLELLLLGLAGLPLGLRLRRLH